MNRNPFVLVLVILGVSLAGCLERTTRHGPSTLGEYLPREGDVVFQALPHSPLVDAIEGATRSPFSHCGLVATSASGWGVVEALGEVRETPLAEWVEQGRDAGFAAYRLRSPLQQQSASIVAAARQLLGRPYDTRYDFNDAKIYCSELVFKAVYAATGVKLGKTQRLGELEWHPYAALIVSLEGAVPIERLMITPQAMSEAPELELVYSSISSDKSVLRAVLDD